MEKFRELRNLAGEDWHTKSIDLHWTSVITSDKMPWENYFVHNSILKSKIIRIALNNKNLQGI